MKSKSALLLLTGIAIGAIGGYLFTPEKKLKNRKELWKKSKKYNKAFKETASKYKEMLGGS
jgi:gas vesicle protein